MLVKGRLTLDDECIHGLAAGMCAACFPAPAPEAEVVAATAARISKARPTIRNAPRRTPGSTTTASPYVDDVDSQRIFHVTHRSNLASIAESGYLFADANPGWTERPTVDISSASTRDDRRNALVVGDSTVAEFVPFFLAPNANVWDSLRSQQLTARLAPDAIRIPAAEFVILVSTVKSVWAASPSVAIADGDAAGAVTRFGTTREDSEGMLRRLRADQTEETMLDAELLVQDSVPFELISLIGVAHDKARNAVRDILAGSAHKPKLSIYPPWFASS